MGLIFYRLAAVNKAQNAQYDVILLDLDMPIMNGYEACQRIRKRACDEIKELFAIKERT
jgi:CheY-like chemotaxis protein